MTAQPKINRRGWLAIWLQNRRRARQNKSLPAPSLVSLGTVAGDTTWRAIAPVVVDDWQFCTTDSAFDPEVKSFDQWVADADFPDTEFTVINQATATVTADFTYCAARYRVGATWSSWTGVTSNLGYGLVAHFGFEELSGNRMDDVNGFALAPVNLDAGTAPGISGNALAFDGSGSYLAGTEETDAFSPTANGFAVSLWVNFMNKVDLWDTVYIASVWDDGVWPAGSPWNIAAIPAFGWVAGEIVGLNAGFNGMYCEGDLTGWAHICVVFDPSAALWSLYIKSDLIATMPTDDYWQVPGRLGVGAHTNPITPPPDAMIDELTIWSRALSATEVAQLYNNGGGLAYESF